jgi:hypothetical protein
MSSRKAQVHDSAPAPVSMQVAGPHVTRLEVTPPPDSRLRRRTHYVVAAIGYLVLASLFIHDWDGFVFENSVRDFWAGTTPYAVAEDQPFYTFLDVTDEHPQWYAYPPLPILAMAFTFLPEILFNVPPPMERMLLKMPMVIGTLALALAGEAWARHLQKPERTVRRVRTLLLFNPFLIIIGPVWGMTDPALMALFLWGALRFQQGHPAQAGVLFALSLLVKPFAALLAIPLAAYFLYERGWHAVTRTAAAATLTTVGVCLPFVLTTPNGFIRQIALFHLARPVQGWSLWRLLPRDAATPEAIGVASMFLISASLLVLAFVAPRVRTPTAPLLLTLAASSQILFWNRVVNDQYLVLIIAPLLLLHGLGDLQGIGRRAAQAFPAVAALATALIGFHWLTFIPPDIALPAFGKPVDVVAYEVRRSFAPLGPIDWPSFPPAVIFLVLVGLDLVLVFRFLRQWIPALQHITHHTARREMHSRAYSTSACVLLLMVALLPAGTPGPIELPGPVRGEEKSHVGAFYYLWWHNPAHDPGIQYGNWLKVSQNPEMGYYTNTRGVARDHVRMMLENGIDVAIVSYHSSEIDRLKVFMEEAGRQGLLVAPLVELNQVYDRIEHHPIGPEDKAAPYAAYRLDAATREKITDFVLELRDVLGPDDPVYRVDGKPVVFFYDSYVSGISYDEHSKSAIARQLLDEYPIEVLRRAFSDAGLQATVDDVLRHYPQPQLPMSPRDSPAKAFYEGLRSNVSGPGGFTQVNQSAYWRVAHLELHRAFWNQIRYDVESELGPVFLVSGEAFNEKAGFEAGIAKALAAFDVFDGSFIYSPSFVWGNQERGPDGTFLPEYDEIFRAWEDRNIWLSTTARGKSAWSSYGVAPAYDDTVNRPERGFKIPAQPGGASTYERMWSSALQHTPDLVVVATFNEFFEGSSIEPSVEFGKGFLNQTRAFRSVLASLPERSSDVLVVMHERSSRTNPYYSEADRPHTWGLRLVAAAERAFPSARVVALDAQNEPPSMRAPALILLEGGRDGYGVDSMSPGLRSRLATWIGQGVPTVVLGREVAGPIRELLPAACRENSFIALGADVADDLDDELDVGDALLNDPSSPAYLLMQRGEDRHVAGYRCPDKPSVAFANIKPWTPTSNWTVSQPVDRVCLRVLASPLVPGLDPSPGGECVGALAPGYVAPSNATATR